VEYRTDEQRTGNIEVRAIHHSLFPARPAGGLVHYSIFNNLQAE
jgi:hypothetical protein